MRKFVSLILTLIMSFTCFALLTSCTEPTSNTKFKYVELKNNESGFTVGERDTSIAIGLAYKDKATKTHNDDWIKINEYLDTLTRKNWDDLMANMVDIYNDENATYTPNYDNSNTTNGDFVVAMECDYAPYNWTQNTNKNGGIAIENLHGKYANGYDVQIAAQVAASLNKRLVIKALEWDALIPAIGSNNVDAIIAGMSPTADRLEEIDFTNDYYSSNLVVITKEGSKIENLKTLKEIDVKGHKIAGQAGTFHLIALQNQTNNLMVVGQYDSFTTMRVALESGTIDGYVAEEPTAMLLCR